MSIQKPEEALEEEELIEVISELLDTESEVDRIKTARHAEKLKELLPLFCAYSVIDFAKFTKCPYCRHSITSCNCYKQKKKQPEIENPFEN